MSRISALFRTMRKIAESLATVFLFSFQYVPSVSFWGGIMLMPLIPWLLQIIRGDLGTREINHMSWLMFTPQARLEWFVFVIGIVIFFVALFHFVAYYLIHRSSLLTTGLYSIVRHPQYLGIILATLGYSIMVIFASGRMPFVSPDVTPSQISTRVLFTIMGVWFLQVVGYLLLALYEERHLLGEFGKKYEEYKQKVPFILPFAHLTRIPEPLLSGVIVIVFVLLVRLLLLLYIPFPN